MIDKNLAPVVLFVYNRPEHTLETLTALKSNHLASSSRLYIFSDGAKPDATIQNKKLVENVQEIIKKEHWCGEVEIRISKVNNGCRKTIESGVTEIVNKYGSLIVVEDDIVTSPYFLTYMNDGLMKYKSEEKVMLIGGFTPPIDLKIDKDVFFLKYATPWGWATWAESWNEYKLTDQELLSSLKNHGLNYKFDFNNSQGFTKMIEKGAEGKMEPWDVCWYASMFLKNGLGVYPKKSLVRNIGFDGTGIHCGTGYWYDIKKLYNKKVKFEDMEIVENVLVRDQYVKFYEGTSKATLKDKIKFKFEFEKKKLKNLMSKNK